MENNKNSTLLITLCSIFSTALASGYATYAQYKVNILQQEHIVEIENFWQQSEQELL